MDPSERYPLFFLWHWLGGSADDFYTRGEVQAAADAQRFIAVLPEEKGDLMFKWPYTPASPESRIDEELRFFDDLLACVAAQFSINVQCITSVGVSAGALWTDQLAGERGAYLSSILSLSGGTGGLIVRPWTSSPHAMPAIVLWGGPEDWCGVDFNASSMDLETNLRTDGHFFVECIHNCGHSEPPLMGASSRYSSLWDFVLTHPYWLPDGASPYLADGLPATFPEWCGIGAGGATIRTGMCGGSACL
jgi:predicted esterase